MDRPHPRPDDLALLLGGNGVLIAGLWLRHGGFDQVTYLGGLLTAAGQLTALYGTYALLVTLVLMARTPWLDELFGIERLAALHRWAGLTAVTLLVVHGVLTTVGWALGDGSTVLEEIVALLTQLPYVLWATVGLALLALAAVSSVRAARRRLGYDTWFGLHLYAYLGFALSFLHQVIVGTDFADDPVARWYWIALTLLAIVLVVGFRFGEPIVRSLRHDLRVAGVAAEGPGTVSVYLTGRDLAALPVRAGQYLRYRFLTRDDWWHAHPFSLSTAPTDRFVRFTAQSTGGWVDRLARMPPGTRVIIEGPYGRLTEARRTRARVVLIAGGIGITPLRALFEDLAGPGSAITLIYRAGSEGEIVFRNELEAIASQRGAHLRLVAGHRGRTLADDPLGPRMLERFVPDIRSADVFICGPDGMIDAVRASLDELRVDRVHVHWERFSI